ncbi:hypothetical protein D9599_24545 [Roseomonas sp. KE2513]|uniref:hypothetical protein n=1 Tax=Roseomonas sp. KE2513 TaxID=2479202 RepID=UPI0018DF329A|nr:hypothetical protein [Roseomonas sp. KE2513]MBI0538733.1 hypothetical protein [Roseomonas sp. KE2513]
MSASLLASVALPRPPALTTVVFEDVHEEGFEGLYGRCHVTTSCHPYRFASRAAASRFANAMCDRYGYDGYRLDTPGFVPPPRPVFDDSEIPF